MRRWHTAGALALALMLAGCAAPPSPAPPSSLQIPADWRTTPTPGAALQAQWWNGFGDPALGAVVQAALIHNTEVRQAATRVAEFRARLQVAQAAQLPTLDASATLGRARALNAFGTTSQANSFQGGLQAAYEVDPWGKLDKLAQAARFDFAAQQAAADTAALSVAASAANGYLNLRGLDAQLDLARATLESRRASLALAQRQFETGYNSRLEWSQAQAEYRAATAAIPQLERAIAQQENALSILTGANPGPILRSTPLSDLRPPPLPSPGLPSELLRRRPDIAQAENAVASADAALAAARDQMLPSLRLSASTALQGFTLTQLTDMPNRLWSLGGSVLAPIFEGGRLQAQTEVATAQRDRALIAYEAAVRAAFAETENALAGVALLSQQLTEQVQREAAASEVLRIVHRRYRNGYSSYLEELDAQRTLYSVQVALIQLQTTLLTTQVDLYRALGGGWR